jgi:hypothetical protein
MCGIKPITGGKDLTEVRSPHRKLLPDKWYVGLGKQEITSLGEIRITHALILAIAACNRLRAVRSLSLTGI